jgi:fatty acid desaturase
MVMRGILTILQTIFITLKLVNVITWNWFWVLSPYLIPIIIIGLVIFIAFIAGLTTYDIKLTKK